MCVEKVALPVEAQAVQTLFAGLVNRVESGAGILLLPAIWTATATISSPKTPAWVQVTLLLFLPRGPGSVGSVSSSFSDITHASVSGRQTLEREDPNGTGAWTYLVSPGGPPT